MQVKMSILNVLNTYISFFSLCEYSKLSWEAMMSQLLLNLHRYDKDGKPVSLIPIVGLTLFSKIYSFFHPLCN